MLGINHLEFGKIREVKKCIQMITHIKIDMFKYTNVFPMFFIIYLYTIIYIICMYMHAFSFRLTFYALIFHFHQLFLGAFCCPFRVLFKKMISSLSRI